jgi:6-phosphofructokinase 2
MWRAQWRFWGARRAHGSPWAGPTGAQHLALMQSQGMDVLPFAGPGETRANWAVSDATGQQYRLQLPGPTWSAADTARAMTDIPARAQGLVVLSGSLPPGMPDSFATDLSAALPSGIRLCIDTSGAALAQVMRAPSVPPFLLRLDQAEAEEQAHHPLVTIAATRDFAQALGCTRCGATCLHRAWRGRVRAGRAGRAGAAFPPACGAGAVQSGGGRQFHGRFRAGQSPKGRIWARPCARARRRRQERS